MSSDELLQTMTLRLVQAGLETSGATLRDSLRPAVGAVDVDALRTVQAIAAGEEPSLTVLSTLGEGGMGIVQLGTQRSLGREVAIKTLRAESRTEDAVARLVREAVVTGALEHPNVVPIYDLAVGEHGVPVIVMKRVEGSTWTVRMRDEASTKTLAGVEDRLEWNLRMLMSVCQAVHFAHSRGVVHRDLKPDNVMVGRFGELYLVDWGISVRVGDGQPQSSRGGGIVGTPAYMAPEMLLGEPITRHTDVYLLGAILFEVLSGRAPHDVPGGLNEVVRSVLGTPADALGSAPPELSALVRRCMQRDPAARPGSAEQVHRALAEFLRHRGSLELAARAERRLFDMEGALRDESTLPDRIPRLYGEVSFGFRAALEAWAENEAARAGFARATRALVRYELSHGMERAARARLADLVEPDDALRAEVEAANARAEAVARKDAALRAEMDPRTGRRARLVLVMLFGTIWTLQPLLQQSGLLGMSLESHLGSGLAPLLVGLLLAASLLWLRSSILGSRINRQLIGAALFALTAQAIAYGGAAELGLSVATTQTFLLFVWFSIGGIGGITIERRIFVPATAFLVAFVVAALDPRLRLVAESMANFVLTITLLFAWRAPRTQKR